MNRSKLKAVRLSLCLYCWIIFLGQPVLSATSPETNSPSNSHGQLLKIQNRVIIICKDLLQIRKSLDSKDRNDQLVADLSGTCAESMAYISNAIDLLWLYIQMSMETDRANVRSYVVDSLKNLAKQLELETQQTNFTIAHTNRPGIATVATELRKAIRESIDILNAVKL